MIKKLISFVKWVQAILYLVRFYGVRTKTQSTHFKLEFLDNFQPRRPPQFRKKFNRSSNNRLCVSKKEELLHKSIKLLKILLLRPQKSNFNNQLKTTDKMNDQQLMLTIVISRQVMINNSQLNKIKTTEHLSLELIIRYSIVALIPTFKKN